MNKLIIISSFLIVGSISTYILYQYYKSKKAITTKIKFSIRESYEFIFPFGVRVFEYVSKSGCVIDLQNVYEHMFICYPNIKELVKKILNKYTETHTIHQKYIIIVIRDIIIKFHIPINPINKILILEI